MFKSFLNVNTLGMTRQLIKKGSQPIARTVARERLGSVG